MKTARFRVISESDTDDAVRIRMPLSQRVVSAALLLLFLVATVEMLTTTRPMSAFVYFFLPFYIIFAVVLLWTCFWRIDLTPQAVTVRTWRKRVIPWAQVEGVALEKLGGKSSVALYRTGQRRVGLQMLSSNGLRSRREVNKGFHAAGHYWATHRGVGANESEQAEPGRDLQIHYNGPIGHYQEAYLTADQTVLAYSAPDVGGARSAWILSQVGFLALFLPVAIVCPILALIFAYSARRKLHEHGMAATIRISTTIRAALFELIAFSVLWAAVTLLIFVM